MADNPLPPTDQPDDGAKLGLLRRLLAPAKCSMLLMLIIPAYLHLRGNPRKEIKNALIWAIILAILGLGWTVFH